MGQNKISGIPLIISYLLYIATNAYMFCQMLEKIPALKQTSAFLMRVSHCDQFNMGYRLCRQSRFSIKMIVVHPLFDSVAFLMCMRGMKSYRSEFLSLKVHTGKTKSNRLLHITSGFVRYFI